jgi:hypothetical protein
MTIFSIFGCFKINIMASQEIQKKIRLLPRASALIVNAPQEYLEMMSETDFDIQADKVKIGNYDLIQVFGSEIGMLEHLVDQYSGSGKYDCLFWICYPKGGGKIKSDLNRNVVWDIARSVGMKCVTQIAIDETWSAIRCRPVEMVGKKQ